MQAQDKAKIVEEYIYNTTKHGYGLEKPCEAETRDADTGSYIWLTSLTTNEFIVACRAILDTCSHVQLKDDIYKAKVGHKCAQLIHNKLKAIIVSEIEDDCIVITGCNLCEVFDVLYKDATIYNPVNYEYFKRLAYGLLAMLTTEPYFRFVCTLVDAIPPRKNKVSDSGYDLVLVRKWKEVGNVTFYDTGIQLAPPIGWYFDLVGRSSISKTGYMLANNIGIIDQSYRGNVIVALVKIDPSAPELQLPARLVQIIPRKVWHMDAVECTSLEHTARGDGGFGSSGSSSIAHMT